MIARDLRALIVHDVEEDVLLVLRELSRGGFTLLHSCVHSADDLRRVLRDESWDIVISEDCVPGLEVQGAVELVEQCSLDLPVVIISRAGGEENAVAAMRAGARDFLVKSDLSRLCAVVQREVGRASIQCDDALVRSDAEPPPGPAPRMEALGRLAGGIAHDYNNVLTVILTHAHLARLDAEGELAEHLDAIMASGRRASRLTHQLLRFSARQSGPAEVVRINKTVMEIERMLRRLIGEHIELSSQLDAELGLIKIDVGQLEQVLLNLAVNARDAMPTGGKLTIETSNTTAEHDDIPIGDYVVLTVTDEGTGMNAETLSHALEPFFTTKSPERGTGLGLSTVNGVVTQNGGHLRMRSVVGEGTTATVYFQRVYDDAPASARTPAPFRHAGSETVLLVEDELPVRAALERLLASSGYDVVSAAHGHEALEICRSRPGSFDVLVTDVIMPHIDGRDLARRILALQPGMKVVYMSGYAEKPSGSPPFIQKPFSGQELLKAIRGAVNGNC